MNSLILTSVLLTNLITSPSVPVFDMEESLARLAHCESGGDSRAINVMDGDASSFGKYQMKIKTFVWLGRRYGLEHSDIWSVQQQEAIVRRALEEGRFYLWANCSRKLKLQENYE